MSKTKKLQQGLASLGELKPGWDSYDAKALDKRVLDEAHELLDIMFTPTKFFPAIVPLPNGGVQFEWQSDDLYFELSIDPPPQQ